MSCLLRGLYVFWKLSGSKERSPDRADSGKLLKKTVSVGNAAQKGAIDTAYIYEDHGSKIETKILNKDIINKTNAIISTMAYIELSTYPGFDEMYVSHINFTCP